MNCREQAPEEAMNMRSLYGSEAAAMASVMILASMLSYGCGSRLPPLKTVDRVDIPRFMGDWYVIASIPTFIEKGAHNAVESYRLDADGTIATTFTFRDGSFEGPLKKYSPRGFIVDTASNAVWGMRFIWPFKAEYLITHLNDGYTQTVIGRNKRDYVWIMARTPDIPEEDYTRLVKELAGQGYDISKLQKVPQRWPEKGR
jgi:apolipoprotein D and lipocalin family protein